MEILNARERAILWLKTAAIIYIPAISIYFLAYAIGQAGPKGLLLGFIYSSTCSKDNKYHRIFDRLDWHLGISKNITKMFSR